MSPAVSFSSPNSSASERYARATRSASPMRPRASSMSSAVTSKWVTARKRLAVDRVDQHPLRSSNAALSRPRSAPPNITMLVSGGGSTVSPSARSPSASRRALR